MNNGSKLADASGARRLKGKPGEEKDMSVNTDDDTGCKKKEEAAPHPELSALANVPHRPTVPLGHVKASTKQASNAKRFRGKVSTSDSNSADVGKRSGPEQAGQSDETSTSLSSPWSDNNMGIRLRPRQDSSLPNSQDIPSHSNDGNNSEERLELGVESGGDPDQDEDDHDEDHDEDDHDEDQDAAPSGVTFVPEADATRVTNNPIQVITFDVPYVYTPSSLPPAAETANPQKKPARRRRWLVGCIAMWFLMAVVATVAALVLQDNFNSGDGTNGNFSASDPDNATAARTNTLRILTDISGELVHREGSPQYEAAQWILRGNSTRDDIESNLRPEELLIQRYALLVLYLTLGGPEAWVEKLGGTTWMVPGLRECQWAGVVCNDEGRVVAFDDGAFDNTTMALQGSLPEEVFELSSMQAFKLHNQSGLAGTLSPSISKWTHLVSLDLSYNALEGTFPRRFPDSLQEIRLQSNRFEGSLVASSFSEGLRILRAQENRLTGTLPPDLATCTNMSELLLGDNALTGTIPEEIYTLVGLERLNLRRCFLNGTISTAIGDLVQLYDWRVDGNSLTGTIPTQFGQLTRLRICVGHTNKLTGTIPTQLGRLRQVYTFSFRGNELTGSLPTELARMESLVELKLYNNQLHRTIPSELTGYPWLEELFLDRNRLSGTIPTGLAKMNLREGLIQCAYSGIGKGFVQQKGRDILISGPLFAAVSGAIRLHANMLSGTIPSELGMLRNLDRLVLNDNNLNGTIPTEFGELRNLTLLWLQNNELNGPIPQEFVQLGKLRQLNIGNNSLTGEVPTAFCTNGGTTREFSVLEADCRMEDGLLEVVCDCCTKCY